MLGAVIVYAMLTLLWLMWCAVWLWLKLMDYRRHVDYGRKDEARGDARHVIWSCLSMASAAFWPVWLVIGAVVLYKKSLAAVKESLPSILRDAGITGEVSPREEE